MLQDRTSVFGTVFMEVVVPCAPARLPDVPGWTLRAWPVARLGDVTLEAAPHGPGMPLAPLLAALRGASFVPLGWPDTPRGDERGAARDVA